MGKKFDRCIKAVRIKIRKGQIKKTFKCTIEGKASKKGKKRCKSNPFAICSRLRRK